jgi:hypothetical protein
MSRTQTLGSEQDSCISRIMQATNTSTTLRPGSSTDFLTRLRGRLLATPRCPGQLQLVSAISEWGNEMNHETSGPVTITDGLGSWVISLVGGGKLRLAAHAFSRQGDDYIFVVLAEGEPDYEIEIASIPVNLVARIEGG